MGGTMGAICAVGGALSTITLYLLLPPGTVVLFGLAPDIIIFTLLGAVIGFV